MKLPFSPDSMLSAGVQFGGNIISSIANAIGARKQHQRQKELMGIQLDNNLRLMQEQSLLSQETWQNQFDQINAYNDPSANRDRLLAAGINPLHSEGSFSSATPSASMPSASGGAPTSPMGHRTDLMNGVSGMIESRTKEREFEVQSEKIRQEVKNLAQECENLEKEGKLTDKKRDDLQSQIDQRKAMVAEETKRTRIQFRNYLVSKFVADVGAWSARNDSFFRQRQLDIEETNAQTMYNESVTHQQELQHEREKLVIEVQKFNANYKIAAANINLAITQAKWNDISRLLEQCKEVSSHNVDSSMEINLGKSTSSGKSNKESISHDNQSGDSHTDRVRNSSSYGGKSGSKAQSQTKSSSDKITTSQTDDLFNNILKNIGGEVFASYKGEHTSHTPDHKAVEAIITALSDSLDAKYEYFQMKGDPVSCAKILELIAETDSVMQQFSIRRGAFNLDEFPQFQNTDPDF